MSIPKKTVWKQPVPTNLNELFGKNYLAKHIYIELLLRARNSDEKPEEEFAGKLHFLKRGQCVCGYKELAAEFSVDHKTVCKTLKKLENMYHKVELKTTNKGTIVTILNYDDVIEMERKTENKWNSKGIQRPPNKSDKSVESEEVATTDILQHFNTVMSKKYKTLPDSNVQHWLTIYTVDEVKQAISMLPKHSYWHDKMDPTLLFRKKNPRQEPVDYIGDLLNFVPKTQSTTSGAEALVKRSITNSQI